MEITEDLISMYAPNANAISNGKKISQKNGFVKLNISKDKTLLFGECSGSGKSNYVTSADFIDSTSPVFRCSCPSRQFPCKHAIGIMFDYLANKTFEEAEIPEDIISKRNKIEVRKEKKEEAKKEPKKVNKAALTKKIKKQIEGLDILDKFIVEIADRGIANFVGNPIKLYEDLAKNMGNYYLNGAQILIRDIIIKMQALKKNLISDEEAFLEISKDVLKLNMLSKKARKYFNDKLQDEKLDNDADSIYEDIGMIWQLEQLKELGLVKNNVRLIQLSFFVTYNEARKEYIDTGIWLDLESGEISKTINYRPIKALKYVKSDDSIFDILSVPELVYYPGGINKRIRFENSSLEKLDNDDILKVIELSKKDDIESQVKNVKNQIKNILSEDTVFALIPFDEIGKSEDKYILSQNGRFIRLKDRGNVQSTVNILGSLPNRSLLNNNILLGEYFYDEGSKKICVMPYAIISKEHIVRLMY